MAQFVSCNKFNEAVQGLNDKIGKKLGSLTDCRGVPITDGGKVLTCEDMGFNEAELNGTKIVLSGGGKTKELDIAALIPPAAADRFLKAVSYNKKAKELVFTIGAQGEADTTIKTPVGDLLLSQVGNGLSGDGSAENPLTLKVDDTLEFTADGKLKVKGAARGATGATGATGARGEKGEKGERGEKGDDGKSAYEVAKANGFVGDEAAWLASLRGADGAAAEGGGLDCAAIAALPQVAWKAGTSVLVSQDGACKRMVPARALFQEIGVGLAASKLNGLTGEKYHVVATVTNTGENANTLTDLTITKPQLGSYTTTAFTTSASQGARVEKVSDFVYKIHNLGSGGTAKVEFDVVPNSVGSFQFGANINPNTAFDLQSNNNSASIVLSATTATAPDYAASVDCPLITATYKGKPLLVDGTTMTTSFVFMSAFNEKSHARANVLISPLKGKSIQLTNASTIVVRRAPFYNHVSFVTYANANGAAYTSVAGVSVAGIYGGALGDINHEKNLIAGRDYTFENGTLTFKHNAGMHDVEESVAVFVRPKGENCLWQTVSILAAKPASIGIMLSTTAQTFEKKIGDLTNGNKTISLHDGITSIVGYKRDNGKHDPSLDENILIRARKGETFTVTASGPGSNNYFASASSAGKTKISAGGNGNRVLTVSVAADATATDSIVFKGVRIEVA